ncbi:MBL fold metallo-hydrolase [Microbacterium sp. BWT-B31]|uniref:MBL fold metallo-hydrolase n=1 Tax=Microbacterium sp. BWT-B31 TaxID=3232072 RepID=UPI00352980D7
MNLNSRQVLFSQIRSTFPIHHTALSPPHHESPRLDRATHRAKGIHVDHVVADGDLLDIPGRVGRVISTPGHTDGSCCFYFADEGLLMLGDHLLPTRFPGIGLGGKAVSGNAVADYLTSLEDLVPLNAAEGLPGHGYRFSGVNERIGDTHAHHMTRNAQICDAFTATGGTVWEVASSVNWSNGWASLSIFHRFSALMQTYHHLSAVEPPQPTEHPMRHQIPPSPHTSNGTTRVSQG